MQQTSVACPQVEVVWQASEAWDRGAPVVVAVPAFPSPANHTSPSIPAHSGSCVSTNKTLVRCGRITAEYSHIIGDDTADGRLSCMCVLSSLPAKTFWSCVLRGHRYSYHLPSSARASIQIRGGRS